MEIITWFQQHLGDLIQIVTAAVALASLIVKITPTLRDDNWLLPIVKFLSRYIALNRTVDDEANRSAQ